MRPKNIIKCNLCSKEFARYPSQVKELNFCSIQCRDEYNYIKKYSHLFITFKNYPNEVAYLFGLILGDGHLKKNMKKTTRITITFNSNDLFGIKIAKLIFSKLKIIYHIEPKIVNNCLVLGFALPDSILEEYNMEFHGNKYKNQPTPIKDIIQNINFAIGLFNSDGCYYRKTLCFYNTVSSIIESLKLCLEFNEIEFKEYHHKYKQKSWKTRLDIRIMKQKSLHKMMQHQYLKWNCS